MRVAVYGPMRSLLSKDEIEVTGSPRTSAELLHLLGQQFPIVAELCQRSRVAVGDGFVSGVLPDYDGSVSISVLPPVSGG